MSMSCRGGDRAAHKTCQTQKIHTNLLDDTHDTMAKLSILLFSLLLCYAAACGGFFGQPNTPVVQSGEAIVFGVTGNKVAMHVLINYEGPAEGFSWMLPVMFEPKLTTGSDPFFRSMFQKTLPQFQFSVDDSKSTCDGNGTAPPCAFRDADGTANESDSVPKDGVEVTKGSVGPFHFQIIRSQERDVSDIRTWLSDNGYDEYAGSAKIINYYVQHDYYFVLLRLKKDTETGDLVPIVLEYEMPEDESMEAIACVPLILTSVAATDSMPILVHILGETRADPINYFRAELNDLKADWLGCQGNDNCFETDYRARAASAFQEVNDHAFVVEYAGPSNVMDNQIRFDIDLEALEQQTSPSGLLAALSDANVPSFPLLDTILKEYIPLDFSNEAPLPCYALSNIYTPANPSQMQVCADFLQQQAIKNAAALVAELDERVFAPAKTAQDFTDSFSYWTRLYVQMSRDNMNKDPFFRFRLDGKLPDVSNVHTAVGVPLCDAKDPSTPSLMQITVDDGSNVTIPVTQDCGGTFRRQGSEPLYGNGQTPAKHFVTPAFGTEEDRLLEPNESGSFDSQAIDDSKSIMDSRVVSQTIPELPPSTDGSSSSSRRRVISSLFQLLYFLL